MINAPSSARDNEIRYQTECQFALEPSVFGLLDKAQAAGWDRRHTAFAILALAGALLDDRAETPAENRLSLS